jgi:hypothetical protein
MRRIFPVASKGVYDSTRTLLQQILNAKGPDMPRLSAYSSDATVEVGGIMLRNKQSEWVTVAFFPHKKSFIIKNNGCLYHNWIVPEACSTNEPFAKSIWDGTILMAELVNDQHLYFSDAAVIAGTYLYNLPLHQRKDNLIKLKNVLPGMQLSEDMASVFHHDALRSRLWKNE